MTELPEGAVSRSRAIGPITLILGITLLAGAVHGRLTQRWGHVPDLLAMAEHLKTFPQLIGEWQQLSQEPMDKSTVEMLSCAGYVNRRYVNRKTGDVVSMAMMLGPSGPIAVHTPEVCYSSRAYSIEAPRKQVSLSDLDGHSHTFWSVSFHSNTPSAERLSVCYAWNAKDVWDASTSPRFEFGGLPYLVKIQLASLVPPLARDKDSPPRNPCEEFLSAMIRCGWSIGG